MGDIYKVGKLVVDFWWEGICCGVCDWWIVVLDWKICVVIIGNIFYICLKFIGCNSIYILWSLKCLYLY